MGALAHVQRIQSRFSVLRAMLESAPTTRQQISEGTALSSATVATVVRELMEARIVSVARTESGGVGRPQEWLQIAPDRGYLLGVDVAETYVTVAVFDLRLQQLDTFTIELDDHENSPDYVVRAIAGAMNSALANLDLDRGLVIGAGVSLPGQVQPDLGTSVFAPNWGWHDVHVEELLGSEVSYPVHVDNALKAVTAAELWFGAGRQVPDLVTVNLGTGVGAGLVADNQLMRGATNNAGEWGHTLLVLDGRKCRCGRDGCVEAYVGVPGVVRTLEEIDAAHPALGIDHQTAFLEAVRVGRAAEEPAMIELVQRTAHYLAAGLGNLINLTNPSTITFAGWTVESIGKWLVPLAQAELPKHTLPGSLAAVSFSNSQVTGNPVAVGMATLTLEHYLSRLGLPSGRAIR